MRLCSLAAVSGEGGADLTTLAAIAGLAALAIGGVVARTLYHRARAREKTIAPPSSVASSGGPSAPAARVPRFFKRYDPD